MIIERFENFSKRINEYASYSESTIIPKMRELFEFKEHKNYKYAVKEGCPEWDIMLNKGLFYSTLEDNRIYFIFSDNGVIGYYADPREQEHYGYIIDCDNKKYDFKNNHSFLELLRKYPAIAF